MRYLIVSLLFCVCAASSARAAQVLHRPSDAEPETLDPQKTSSDNPIAIDRDMFTGLVDLSPTLKAVPGVAESWDVSSDGKLWTFHLRPNAKWSNGELLTAEDFVYTFRRLVDPKTAASDIEQLEQVVNAREIAAGREKDLSKLGVVATDRHTLTITLTEPRATFLYLMTDPQTFPLHRATLEKWGNEWTKPDHIVSDGPFVMKSWTPQSEIVLQKNSNFYDAGSVKLDEVHWVDTEDLQAGLRRFRAGELDWARLDLKTMQWARQNDPDEMKSAPADGNYFLFFNMTKGPLAQDIRIRQAINLAINREVIVKNIDNRGEQPAYGIVPPVVPDYTPQAMPFKSMPMADRLKQAKELLAAVGYGPDKKLQLSLSYTTGEAAKEIVTAIRQMLEPIGVDLTLDNMEWQVFVNRVNTRDYQLGFMGTEGSYANMESALQNYWSGAGIFNFTGYSNPKFDAVYVAGMTEMDADKRRAEMEEAERTMLSDYPVVPLEYDQQNFLVTPKLAGFLANVRFPQSRYLSFKDSAS